MEGLKGHPVLQLVLSTFHSQNPLFFRDKGGTLDRHDRATNIHRAPLTLESRSTFVCSRSLFVANSANKRERLGESYTLEHTGLFASAYSRARSCLNADSQCLFSTE